MRFDCFKEFKHYDVFSEVQGSTKVENVEYPSESKIIPTKTFGEEQVGDIQFHFFKLFYSEQEEESGDVDKLVKDLEAAGVKVVDRHPYKESIVETDKGPRSDKIYFKDRIILSVGL